MISGISWRIGKVLSKKFPEVRSYLKIAGIKKTSEEYLGQWFLISVFLSIATGPPLIVLMDLLQKVFPSKYLFILILTIPPIVFFSVFLFSLFYPKFKAEERRHRLENVLPFACCYMACIASSGVPPYMMFKFMAKMKEFGEVSKECQSIERNMEIFGYTFSEALSLAMRYSPSPKWKELLSGILSTSTGGGDITSFLLEASKKYSEEMKRKIKDFSHLVSILLEIYITIVITGTIMSNIMILLMGVMGGLSNILLWIQYALTFFLVPVATFLLILFIRAASPVKI